MTTTKAYDDLVAKLMAESAAAKEQAQQKLKNKLEDVRAFGTQLDSGRKPPMLDKVLAVPKRRGRPPGSKNKPKAKAIKSPQVKM